MIDTWIDLQAKTKVPDGLSGETVTWTTIASDIKARKTTHRSDEAVQAMQATGTLIHNFRIRYRKGVRSSWRVVEGNKIMAIIGPPIEVFQGPGRRFLDITVKETA